MIVNRTTPLGRLVRRALIGSLAGLAVIPAVSAAAGNPAPIPATAGWLTTVNYFRAMAGLGPVVEDGSLSAGAVAHSCYMLANGMAHDEVPSKPGYTPEGDAAGNNGNVAVTSVFGQVDRAHVELWMTGPFHAIGVLRPNLISAGFGKCDDQAASPWKSAATLDVLRGLGPKAPLAAPILFPGQGAVTSLDRFVAETPDPRSFCGWTGTTGLPLIAQMPEVANGAVSTVTGPNGPVETCTLTSANTTGVGQATLAGENGVIVMPKSVLAPGTYTVTVQTPARTVTWSFTVDPAAKTVAPTPVPVASPTSGSLAFAPLTPVRVADTREGFGAPRLTGGVPTRIQVAGVATVPGAARAVAANFTVTGTAGAGFLTVWNCADQRPVASTVNFAAGDTIPNAANVPLDSNGGVCVFSPVDTDLVIDIAGSYAAKGDTRFAAITPTRLLDTRSGHGGTLRLTAGGTAAVQVAGQAGIPAGTDAAVLNVTSVDPARQGYVTVYPCDQPLPLAAALNPMPGEVRPNLVISPLAADGTVCLFSSTEVDLIADVTGYLADSTSTYTASAPFRYTDTRDAATPELNAGLNGVRPAAGTTITLQVAGSRGIPANAKAVSINIAAADAGAAGFLTAYPCGARPTTSNVNYRPAKAASTGAIIPLSATGQLCIYTNNPTQVIVDVNGWWS